MLPSNHKNRLNSAFTGGTPQPLVAATMPLPWFPPAPAPGPASILSLPPDDWVMQPKIDGIRVIIYGGQPFNRMGEPLSAGNGAATLRACSRAWM